MHSSKKVGLSLSGGGYRAAAFHLGTLKKLNDMGILEKVDVLSTISGGSIIGAYYCLHEQSFEHFEKRMYDALNQKSVKRNILLSRIFWRTILALLSIPIASYLLAHFYSTWLLLVFLPLSAYLFGRYQFIIFPVSKQIEKAYDEFFFSKATLSQLKQKPELAIGSTNLQTCRPFTFSKRKMEDSHYAYMDKPVMFNNTGFPLARAVAASTCVPHFFSPIKIDSIYFLEPRDASRVSPALVDGGIYDNQGIQKITQPGSSYECDFIITSDAGNNLPFQGSYNNTFVLLLRTVEAFMVRIKNFQMAQNLYRSQEKNRAVAYFSLGWDLENCISGFLRGLKNGNIPEATLRAHKIPEEYIENPGKYGDEIAKILAANTGYLKILANDLSPAELIIARSVKTDLARLSTQQLNCLIKHAENLSELQVRLYCPELLLKADS